MSDFYNFLRNNVRMMGNFLQRIGIKLFEGLSEPYDLWIIAITLMPQQGKRHAHFFQQLRLQRQRARNQRQMMLLIVVLTVARRGGYHGVIWLRRHKQRLLKAG